MTQTQAGLKSTLDQIDNQIVQINKELSENSLLLLNLKNQRAKLGTIFEIRVEETERNFKLDVEKFEEQLNRSFKNHVNLTKMLDKKVDELRTSQQELALNLSNIEQKVKEMIDALG